MARDANLSMETKIPDSKLHHLEKTHQGLKRLLINLSVKAHKNQNLLSENQVQVYHQITIVTFAIAESHHHLSSNRIRFQPHPHLSQPLKTKVAALMSLISILPMVTS